MDDLVFLATSRTPHCTLRLDKHVVGYYTMQFMDEGAVELAYDDDWATLSGGAWFWPAYPGPRLRFHPAPPAASWSHRHVGFSGPLVHKWIAQGLWPDRAQPAPPAPTGDWPAFFDTLITRARRGDRWGRLRATNQLEQLLLELAEARASPPVPDRPVWLVTTLAALDTLADSHPFAPDYDGLAADVGMAIGTLRRRFKAAMGGTTLHGYVIERRIARARVLLGESDAPLRVIAARLGYDNEYFFSRQFRQVAGVAPQVYRRSRQG